MLFTELRVELLHQGKREDDENKALLQIKPAASDGGGAGPEEWVQWACVAK